MQEIQFDSLSEYIQIINELPTQFNCHPGDIWYRGIKDDNLRLLPGAIWRDIPEAKEELVISEFLTYYQNYTDKHQDNPFDRYALMQHYGLPTRLLDWSLSPVVALFFALEKNRGAKTRTIWAMQPHEINEVTLGVREVISPSEYKRAPIKNYLPHNLRSNDDDIPTEPVAISLPLVNQRAASQKGAFTLHGFNDTSIDQFFQQHNLKNMVKISLRSEEHREKIQNQLYAIGIKEDDIYQDLNSLSKRIIREFEIKK